MLAQAWPELEVVAQARNGREAVERFEAQQPDICFLDVHMPGLSGVEAARQIGRRAHLVFVTAFDRYALQAFEEGVLDYWSSRSTRRALRARWSASASGSPPRGRRSPARRCSSN